MLYFFGCIGLSYSKTIVYPTVSKANIRSAPTVQSKIIGSLSLGRRITTTVNHANSNWLKVNLSANKQGFIFKKLVAQKWIKIWKKERALFLMDGHKPIKKYRIALGFNPVGDKKQQGDGCTPTGRFFICEMLKSPKPKAKYGARSMRISYPNSEDARRGLKEKLISKAAYFQIIKQNKKGIMPSQQTKLGGSIRIHGGGTVSDWTLGCIAMRDEEITVLYDTLPSKNALVEIYNSEKEDLKINTKSYVNHALLKTAQNLLKTNTQYTQEATQLIKLDYPMGDISPNIGVCTDVIIRALRGLSIDLQALLHEDVMTLPGKYPLIKKPNANIDHRRTRILKHWFDQHTRSLTLKPPLNQPQDWLPGDIVLMDTGVQNGTIYDHIGIVSDRYEKKRPLVINLWTIGYQINQMDLLSGDYPTIVGHYRMGHLFDYGGRLNNE